MEDYISQSFYNMQLVIFVALVALAAARPQNYQTSPDQLVLDYNDYYSTENYRQLDSQDSSILHQDQIYHDDGSVQYSYETSDQQAQDVTVGARRIGDQVGAVMQGSYSFVAQDEFGNDVPVTVTWVADENGYRAESDFIPVAPVDTNAAAQEAARDTAVASGYSQDQDQYNDNGQDEQYDQYDEVF